MVLWSLHFEEKTKQDEDKVSNYRPRAYFALKVMFTYLSVCLLVCLFSRRLSDRYFTIQAYSYKAFILLTVSTKPGHWHNGSVFIFCAGDSPFKSEPTRTSADAHGEVTSFSASHQEVSRYSTRGGSEGMYITFASAKSE